MWTRLNKIEKQILNYKRSKLNQFVKSESKNNELFDDDRQQEKDPISNKIIKVTN